MVKITCDKCGSEILPPKKPKKLKYALHYMHFGLFGETKGSPTVEYDICPGCADVLLSWLEHTKEE